MTNWLVCVSQDVATYVYLYCYGSFQMIQLFHDHCSVYIDLLVHATIATYIATYVAIYHDFIMVAIYYNRAF